MVDYARDIEKLREQQKRFRSIYQGPEVCQASLRKDYDALVKMHRQIWEKAIMTNCIDSENELVRLKYELDTDRSRLERKS